MNKRIAQVTRALLPKSRYYRLEGHEAVPCSEAEYLSCWKEGKDRIVGRTNIGRRTVSTIFLALDHGHLPEGPPLLFETLVFGEMVDRNELMRRYSTWEEAEQGHADIVAALRAKEAA